MVRKAINLRLENDLLERAKAKAESLEITLTRLIEKGLELALANVDTDVKTNSHVEALQSQIDQLKTRMDSLENKHISRVKNNELKIEAPNVTKAQLLTDEELQQMHRDDIRKYATTLGISGAWKKNKGELIYVITGLRN